MMNTPPTSRIELNVASTPFGPLPQAAMLPWSSMKLKATVERITVNSDWPRKGRTVTRFTMKPASAIRATTTMAPQ